MKKVARIFSNTSKNLLEDELTAWLEGAVDYELYFTAVHNPEEIPHGYGGKGIWYMVLAVGQWKGN
jgi:hypothetical protein